MFAGGILPHVEPSLVLETERSSAASPEHGHLVPTLVDGAVPVEALGDRNGGPLRAAIGSVARTAGWVGSVTSITARPRASATKA